eukprot:TRINITY_DN36_c14_g1_i1.p1 TRINITY_DN36_c14_g1~~TRINITY_DN36_c14_g1_i1.p1  ORF type:complete len:114 (+),score=18.08 TRINITY_DN36_c14_g1_i1:75-416(+)
MKLNLALRKPSSDDGTADLDRPKIQSYDQEANIFAPITVHLQLPDGTTRDFHQTTGDTVQIIKKKMEVELGLPYARTQCFLNGKFMMEPLSLNDFPSLPTDGSPVTIEVRNKE